MDRNLASVTRKRQKHGQKVMNHPGAWEGLPGRGSHLSSAAKASSVGIAPPQRDQQYAQSSAPHRR
jgi:hypothetical protein